MMDIALVIALIGLGIRTSLSDIKVRKIYNKDLILFWILGGLIYLLFNNEYSASDMVYHLLNVTMSFIVGVIFYRFKVWAAGDAKLFSTCVFLIPSAFYEVSKKNLFPAFYILVMIFSIAYIYVVIETLFLMKQDRYTKRKYVKISEKIRIPETLQWIKDFCVKYMIGYNIIILIDRIVRQISEEFFLYNQGIIWLMHIFILMYLYNKIGQRLWIIFVGTLILNLSYLIITPSKIDISINMGYLLIVGVVLLMRNQASQYNYKIVKVEDILPGMILSYPTVMNMLTSKVRGLPKFTDETTNCRLTIQEVEAIKRWKGSKYGANEVIVVRHLPFAPFIIVGVCMFLISRR